MSEFRKFPSIPRLVRGCVVTEKIDGTNACVVVEEYQFGHHVGGVPEGTVFVMGPCDGEDGLPTHEYLVYAQSRNQLITPGKSTDNHGFAGWVWECAAALADTLGPGYHYGEWWGSGIQRGYGLPNGEKRFSLFNTGRWTEENVQMVSGLGSLSVVPVLWVGTFSEPAIVDVANYLEANGSAAAPGFMNPEGIVIYHQAARQLFKYTLDGDGHKSA